MKLNLGLRCFWETQPTSEMFKGPVTGDEPSWDMLINVYSKRWDFLFILTSWLYNSFSFFLVIISLNKLMKYYTITVTVKCKLDIFTT